MSARPGVLASVVKPADGGVSPNNYVGTITAEVRAFWPPRSSPEDVEEAIQEAADEAIRMHRERRADG